MLLATVFVAVVEAVIACRLYSLSTNCCVSDLILRYPSSCSIKDSLQPERETDAGAVIYALQSIVQPY